MNYYCRLNYIHSKKGPKYIKHHFLVENFAYFA